MAILFLNTCEISYKKLEVYSPKDITELSLIQKKSVIHIFWLTWNNNSYGDGFLKY
jgi:hypothetical protein